MSQRLLLNPMTESYFSCWGTAGKLATGVLSSYFLVSAHVYIGRHVGGGTECEECMCMREHRHCVHV